MALRPTPFNVAIDAFAAGAIAPARGAASRAGSAILSSGVSAVQQGVNSWAPNYPPEVAQLFDAYFKVQIGREGLAEGLKFNGVSLRDMERNANWHRWWAPICRANLPTPSIEEIFDLHILGYIDPRQQGELLNRAGVNRLFDSDVDRSQWMNYLKETTAPASLDLIRREYWRPGGLRQWANQELERLLIRPGVTRNAILDDVRAPGSGEILELLNRRYIDEAVARTLLALNDVVKPEHQDLFLALRNRMPSLSDIQRYAVREVWDPGAVTLLGLDEEFPAEFRYWAGKAGYDWTENVTLPDGRVIPGVPWPIADWRAHWQQMPAGLAYLAYQRFRPGRMNKWRVEFPNLREFSKATLDQILKINDFAPGLRDWLAALSRPPMRFFDVRATIVEGIDNPQWFFFTTGLNAANFLAPEQAITDWATEEFKDRGYSERDAKHTASLFLKKAKDANDRKKNRRLKAIQDKTAAGLIDQYATGMLTKAQLDLALQRFAWRQDEIDAAAAQVDNVASLTYVKTWIKRVRRYFTSGRITDEYAIEALKAGGIRGDKAVWYVQQWLMLFGEGMKFASTRQSLDWFEKGWILPQDLLLRLSNLGWTNPEALLWMQQAYAELQDKAAKGASLANKNRIAAAKEVERIANAAARQAKEMQAELRRLTPPSFMQKLMKHGRISEDFFRRRFKSMGFPERETELYFEESQNGGSSSQAGPP